MTKGKLLLISFLSLASLLMGGAGEINAQPIQGDFNRSWVVDTIGNGALPGNYLRPGTQPVGWQASNVHQKVLMEKKEVLVTPDTDRLGGNGFSVRMENKFLGVMNIGSNAPAYVTLGTPWVYAVMDISACGGGTLGGIAYTQRPDSLVGYYKRQIGIEGAEPAIINTYFWKGSSLSTVNVNPAGGLTSTETRQVVDQDQCILGNREDEGGDARLIGKAEYQILTELSEWTRISIPIDYLNDEFPEKANIIISSANYSDRANIKAGNILWADDVELVCNAELKRLAIGGAPAAGFDPKTYMYQYPAALIDAEIDAEAYGKDASVQVTKAGNVKTIKVTDATAKGAKEYTYSLTFKGEKTTINVPQLPEKCVYGQVCDFVPTSNNTQSEIVVESSNSDVVLVEGGKLKFNKVGFSTITITQAGNDAYTPEAITFVVEVTPAPLTISLKDVTSMYGKSPVYKFGFMGMTQADEALAEEKLTNVFSTEPKAEATDAAGKKVTTSSAMGTYTIKWTNTPQASNYTITLDETPAQLTIGKGEIVVTMKLKRKVGEANPSLIAFDYTGLVTADRQRNSETQKYEPKPEIITGGSLSAAFEGVAPTADSPAAIYPIVITCDYTSDKYNFVVGEGNCLLVQTDPTLNIIDFPEEVFYGDTIRIKLTTSNDNPEKEFLYYARKVDNVYNVTFLAKPNEAVMVATGVGNAQIEVFVKEINEYTQVGLKKDFVVKKAPLTVTALDATRMYGEPNPEFVLAYKGFVNGDDEGKAGVFITAPSVSCVADETAAVGVYDILVEPGESDKYEIQTHKGVLTVQPVVGVDVTQQASLKVYAKEGILYVEGNKQGEIVSVYNITGTLIGRFDTEQIRINNLVKEGIYVVKSAACVTTVLIR